MTSPPSTRALGTTRVPTVGPPVRPGHAVLGHGRMGLRINVRVLGLTAFVLLVTAMLGTWALTWGEYDISTRQVLLALVDAGDPRSEFLVRELRLPRVLAAVVVGAALALSGAVFQGVIRNELASPDIIGINSGAGMVGFVWLMTIGDVTSLPIALFAGAMGMAALIYLLSWKGGISQNRLILVGIGVAALLGAVQQFMIRRFPIEDAIWAQNLLLGSVADATWGDVALVSIGLTVLVPVLLLLSWPLRALQLGDDTARTVGWPVELVRFALMFLGAWLCALSISVTGLISFIALLVPHAARAISGPVSGSVLLFTAALGAFTLLGGDLVAHHLIPVDLPVDVVMGAIGAPYFLLLFWLRGARV